jgi:hypothetical protein
MSYIQKSLGDGETIVALARFHWWYSVKAWLALLVPLALLASSLGEAEPITRQAAMFGGLALLAIGVVVFLRLMIHKRSTEIGVTSHRFVKKTGFLSLHTNEFALANIEGVRVTQSLWGKLWGYGRLRIEGTGDDSYEIPNIADPVGFRRAIETAKGMKG